MYKIIVALFSASLLFAACKKEEKQSPKPSPTVKWTPSKSYIKIKIDDKTIEARDTFLTPYESSNYFPFLTQYSIVDNEFKPGTKDKTLSISSACAGRFNNGKLKFLISASSYSRTSSSPIDTYRTLNNSATAFYVENLTDSPKVVYQIKTGSTIAVSYFDEERTEGTLQLQLKNVADGTDKDATGEFKIYFK